MVEVVLLETGDFLLLENGDFLLLESSTFVGQLLQLPHRIIAGFNPLHGGFSR